MPKDVESGANIELTSVGGVSLEDEVLRLAETFFISKPLNEHDVKRLREIHGKNILATSKKVTWYKILFGALFHPFNILLGILAAASGILEEFESMCVTLLMVVLSLLIRFVQEYKSALAADNLKKLVSNTVCVLRYSAPTESKTSLEAQDKFVSTHSSRQVFENQILNSKEILLEEIVPGDWVKVSAGDLIPADIIIIESKDIFVSQSSLTGEAIPVEKYVDWIKNRFSSGNIRLSKTENTSPPIIETRMNRFKSRLRSCCHSTFGLRDRKISANMKVAKAELDNPNLCYMGTSVVSGTATAFVNFTGNQTYFGSMALELAKQRPQNAFQRGVRRISWIFFLVMVCLVPPIFLLQGILHNGEWVNAALFALSAAVGLTPEMLPMIVSSTLARGAYLMSKKKCIVKNLDSIINMGGMDVLCTDKTGTLTENRVSLMRHVDYYGNTSLIPIQLAFLNSFFQSGLKNLMDIAVVEFFQHGQNKKENFNLASNFIKIDEIPFDFVRRRMSVLLKSEQHNLLITKGAVEEMLGICSQVYKPIQSDKSLQKDDIFLHDSSKMRRLDLMSIVMGDRDLLTLPSAELCDKFTSETMQNLSNLNDQLNEYGFRVIAVAFKAFDDMPDYIEKSDECNMTFVGLIAFQDPPKESALPAIRTLLQHNVQVKVLTGDSAVVCRKICEDINLPVTGIVTTTDLEGATDEEICKIAESATIFAKLTPLQKAQVVRALKFNDHIVGFLGDGINDANALIEADIGISVDNGTDIARDAADIILLEKDLMVVAEGVSYGRLTYGNTLKYIVMAVSSNFGNSFSLLVASAWLKFQPMAPIQLLMQNLLYDIAQIAIPWDNMDPEFLMIPHRWSMVSIITFMICLGPWSSVFDVTTFAFLYFHQGIRKKEDVEGVKLFHTTWFLVGILTQLFVVHMLRTQKIPFFQSIASIQVILMTIFIMGIAIALPWIPYAADVLHFTRLTPTISIFIFFIILAYCITTQITKLIYVKSFKRWY